MLSYLSSWIYTDKNDDFRHKLTKRLNKQAINTADLLTKLEETNSIIAGSYPLQTILNEEWESSDLDIFTGNKSMLKYFDQFYTPYLLTDEKDKYKYTYESKVVEYKTPTNFKIQVIYSDKFALTSDNIAVKDKVFKHFDFDFCKVGFDGKTLYVANPKAVKDRKITYDFSKLTMKTYERLLKYEKRGFTLTNRDEFVDKMIRQGDPDKNFVKKLSDIISTP